MSSSLQFILIDDSDFDLFLNKEFLQLAGVRGNIESFDSANNALKFILREGESINESIILLDIHMPLMDGFEFLDKFNLFPDYIKKRIKIIMVSSTVDERDLERALSNPFVVDILSKPLNGEKLRAILNKLE